MLIQRCKRWIFYVAGSVTGLAPILCVGIRESHPSQLLGHRLRVIQKMTGDDSLHIQTPDDALSLYAFVQT